MDSVDSGKYHNEVRMQCEYYGGNFRELHIGFMRNRGWSFNVSLADAITTPHIFPTDPDEGWMIGRFDSIGSESIESFVSSLTSRDAREILEILEPKLGLSEYLRKFKEEQPVVYAFHRREYEAMVPPEELYRAIKRRVGW